MERNFNMSVAFIRVLTRRQTLKHGQYVQFRKSHDWMNSRSTDAASRQPRQNTSRFKSLLEDAGTTVKKTHPVALEDRVRLSYGTEKTASQKDKGREETSDVWNSKKEPMG
jgi:hypothetical protein